MRANDRASADECRWSAECAGGATHGKPSIDVIEDGPLCYHTAGVGVLRDASGAILDIPEDVALCRCGGSADMPFCDGAHTGNGFTTWPAEGPSVGKLKDYRGSAITVHFNLAACAHVAYCVQELPAVFDTSRRPWILPDAGAVGDIIAICEKCPSGALSYTIDGVRHRDLDRAPAVVVSDRGPLCTEGGVEVLGVPLAQGVSPEHRTLCSCGVSRNKPLCDGSHRPIGLPDQGE